MTFPFAFTIPYLVLSCIHFDLAVGERFGNFEIQQPMERAFDEQVRDDLLARRRS